MLLDNKKTLVLIGYIIIEHSIHLGMMESSWMMIAINSIVIGKITSKHKIKECDFFLGWDVNFTYSKDEKQYSFQWNTNNHVFLMSEGKPEIKDETKENRTEKYYCFDVSDVSDGGALLQRLDQLINQYENAQLSRF